MSSGSLSSVGLLWAGFCRVNIQAVIVFCCCCCLFGVSTVFNISLPVPVTRRSHNSVTYMTPTVSALCVLLQRISNDRTRENRHLHLPSDTDRLANISLLFAVWCIVDMMHVKENHTMVLVLMMALLIPDDLDDFDALATWTPGTWMLIHDDTCYTSTT